MPEPDTEERRKEVFRALVESQDNGMTVQASRDHIGKEFNLESSEILEIERAGIDAKWPPL